MQRELDEVSLIQIKYFLRTDNKARCTCLNWQGATIKGRDGMLRIFAQKNLMQLVKQPQLADSAFLFFLLLINCYRK